MENSAAAKPGGGKKLFIALGAIVILAAAAFGGLKYYEGELAKKYAERLNDFAPYLTGSAEKVEISLLSRSIKMTNATMEFNLGPDIPLTGTVKIGETLYEGVSWDVFEDDNFIGSSVDSVTLRNVETITTGSSSKVAEMGYKNVTVDPLKARPLYIKLRDLVRKGEVPEEKVIIDTIAQAYDAIKTARIGGAYEKNHVISFGEGLISGSLSLESSESGPWTIMEGGPSVARNCSLEVMGKPAATIGEIGLKHFRLGDLTPLVEILRNAQEDSAGTQVKVVEFLSKNQISIEDAYLKQININPALLQVKDGVSADLLGATLKIGPQNEYSLNLKKLKISRAILDQLAMFSPELETALESFEGPLELDKSVNILYGQADKTLAIKGAADLKGIGSASGGMEMVGPDFFQPSGDKIEQSIESAKFKSMNLEVTDLKLSDIIFAVADVTGDGPDAMRAMAVEEIQAQIGREKDPFLGKLLDGALKLLQGHGTLKVSFKPATPLSVEDIGALDGNNIPAEKALGGSVEYLPAAAPAQK